MPRRIWLKTLVSEKSAEASLNLAEALKAALPPATLALLRAVAQQAERQGVALYLVGGFVRDLLLGHPSLDLDLVVEGDAIRLGRSLAKRFGGQLTVHKRFGTAVWLIEENKAHLLAKIKKVERKKFSSSQLPDFLDLISARRETYAHPGALPVVEFSDLRQDQYRRDFTSNTLAVRLDGPHFGALLDPWGGLSDLRRGQLRVLHDRSFIDDPTRILRILRLSARLHFQIEKHTLQLLKQAIKSLGQISGERIRNELSIVLAEARRNQILLHVQKLGVLRAIHPNLRFGPKMAHSLARQPDSIPGVWELNEFSPSDFGFILWFMHLSPQGVSRVAAHLRFSQPLQRASVAAARLRPQLSSFANLPPSQIVARLEKEPLPALYALYLENEKNKTGSLLLRYAKKWRHVQPRLDGHALRKKGLHPGPAYRHILWRLRAAWLDGKVRTEKQERALLEHLLDEHR